MSKNQNHGIVFEELVLQSFGIKKINNSYAFDIPFVAGMDFLGNIKTVKAHDTNEGVLGMSDARRVFSWFDTINFTGIGIKLIVGLYDQIDHEKIFHTVVEVNISNNNELRKLFYGNISLNEVYLFHSLISLDYFNEDDFENCRTFAKKTKERLALKSGIIALNPKIDSKKQRRIQCSIKLSDLIGKKHPGLEVNVYKNSYNGIQLPLSIDSSERFSE